MRALMTLLLTALLLAGCSAGVQTEPADTERFAAGGYDEAAKFCATTMMPMYFLSIPSIATFLVLSIVLIGD